MFSGQLDAGFKQGVKITIPPNKAEGTVSNSCSLQLLKCKAVVKKEGSEIEGESGQKKVMPQAEHSVVW